MNVMNYSTRDVVTVAPTNSIDRAISLMEEHSVHHLVVVQNDRVVGMLSDRDILISTGWMLSVERRAGSDGKGVVIGPTAVEQIMSRPAVCLTKGQSAREAASLMFDRRISALPVLQDGRLIGILSDSDLMKWLDGLALTNQGVQHFLRRPVGELLRARVVTVAPESLLVEVTDIFRRRRVRHVPVVQDGAVVGIISDRDVRRSLGWSNVRELQAEKDKCTVGTGFLTTAGDIMQKKVLSTERSARAQDALRLMLAKHIHSLPVMEEGKLMGIITQTDFIKTLAHQDLL